MKLSEIFSQLTAGELSQLGLGGAKSGAIAVADYPKIVGHVNLGLTDLFTRFDLLEGRQIVVLEDGKTSYVLGEDVLKVERVLNQGGEELALNVETDPYSVVTPSVGVIRVPQLMVSAGDKPDYLKTSQLEVFYRAAHPVLLVSGPEFDPAQVDVALPRPYLQALLYFVASRAHNPAGMTNEFHTGNSYYAKYDAECARLDALNLEIDQNRGNYRLERNGWV